MSTSKADGAKSKTSVSQQAFDKPHDVDDALLAFPGRVAHLMPPYLTIPDEFKNGRGPYVKFQQDWFFSGLKPSQIPPARPGIDKSQALRHLRAIQRSFEPKHEHKEAAVAYLASLWLEEPSSEAAK